MKTLPDRVDGKIVESGRLKITDVAQIWYGACAHSQPGKAAKALFNWLDWVWEKKKFQWRGNDPSDRQGGKPTLAVPKKFLLQTVKEADFQGFGEKARNAKGLRGK